MSDYKETLNLPKTAFSMKANLPQREPQILQQWRDQQLYQRIRDNMCAKPRFVLHDGPPYANGRPHLGTALNKTLKDIVVKAKTLSGYDAPYVPGWDCHGLPIEINVEKKHGKPGDKCSREQFRKACRDYARSQVAIQAEDFQRLGVIGDWQHPYLTMDFSYEANTVKALAAMVANGHLYRGQKPVHWCTACGSALAEAEVEYRDKASPSIDVAFSAVEPNDIFQRFDIAGADTEVIMPIWTTTPWTLPANQAVCVNPDLHYAIVHCQLHGKSTYLVLAKDLLDSALQRFGIDDYEVHGNILGAQLEKIELQHPFLERKVPVLLGKHVSTEAGTGNVHTAPAHGLDDYLVGMNNDLPIQTPVDARSCFRQDEPFVGGLHVFKANEPIIVALADSGKLLQHSVLQHSYPHCWRHKTPLIFRATPQWFISMDQAGLRKQALAAIKDSQWIPSWGESRIYQMIADRPDWCISRQRTWGIPLTFFVHKETQALHPNMPALMHKIAERISEQGIDGWFDCDSADFIGDEAKDYDKVTDVLDVWFDSGSSHYCVLRQREDLACPADLYLEGSDQHRGWFQSSLLTSLAIDGAAPFKSVLTHGYVVDGQGRKMSKSIGNVIFPADVVKNLGADVLRLWAASTDHRGDINVSQEILKRTSEAYRRIRNTARFLLSNLNDFDPTQHQVPVADMVELDRWAIIATCHLQQRIIKAYDNYHFQTIYQLIHNFCTVEMGSFYLDIIKDRQYTAKKDSKARRSAQTALYHILQAFVRWLAPILSFTAEEIWGHMLGTDTDSVFLTEWHTEFPEIKDSEAVFSYWQWFMQLRDEVNKVLEAKREQGDIGSALDAEVVLFADGDLYEKLKRLDDELRFALITSDAKVLPEADQPAQCDAKVDGLAIKINISQQQKCVRCWQRRDDVGKDAKHPELCERCVVNVVGEGETRLFA